MVEPAVLVLPAGHAVQESRAPDAAEKVLLGHTRNEAGKEGDDYKRATVSVSVQCASRLEDGVFNNEIVKINVRVQVRDAPEPVPK